MRIVGFDSEVEFDVQAHIFSSKDYDIYLTKTGKCVIAEYGGLFHVDYDKPPIISVITKPHKKSFWSGTPQKRLQAQLPYRLPPDAKNAIFEAFEIPSPYFHQV